MSDSIFENVSETPAKKPVLEKTKAPTVLDQLKEVLAKKVERDPVFVEVPEREGVTVQISPNITQHQLSLIHI